MKKHEIVEELRQRNKFFSKLPAKELQSFFDFEIHGIQRLPALLLPLVSPSRLLWNTDSWPLHDFMNYIKNLFEELPLYLPKEKKKKSCVTSSILLMQKKLKKRLILQKKYRICLHLGDWIFIQSFCNYSFCNIWNKRNIVFF